MSYILDALKKADREREQGQVPGLNAQPAHDALDEAPALSGLSPLVWAGVGMALTLAGVLAWRAWPSPTAADARTVEVRDSGGISALPQPMPGAQRAPSSGMPQPPTAQPAPHDDRATSASAADGVAMQVDGAPVSRSAVPVLSVPGPGSPREGDRQSGRATALPPTEPGPAVEGTRTSLPQLSELPESLRKEMPPLQTGGAMHSPNRAQRMLVLNGQVFHEGDSPEPGLRLEEIRLKSAVLSYKGQRFEVQY